MCGISGWLARGDSFGSLIADADRFSGALHHRGPDNSGHYRVDEKGVYLGHNRLSIIDLSDAGNQPMVSDTGNAMVLNGEIYNYQSIKKELLASGHHFTSESDSEVVLKSFQEWGIDFTEKLKGMYALAIWSSKEQTLHLLRDPLGIKPLYFWQMPNQRGVVFASELRALLKLSDFSAVINRNALSQYLEFGYTFDPTQTVFENVYKLQPGHRLEIRNGKPAQQIRFYQPETKVRTYEYSKNLEAELYTILSQVVQEHMIADVPVGLLLSGGLDSSLIAALASKHEKIHTFSMGFANSDVDERPFARKVSEHIGSNHKEILIQPNEVMSDLENVAAHYDDIFADWGMISTRLLYQRCKEHGVKVVLVGEGSDELFGGYNVFKHALKDAPQEWQLFQLYRRYAGRRYGKHYLSFRSIMKEYLRCCDNDLFSAIRLFESRNQLPNNFVQKVDKASMSVSLEARTPFLDSRVADIAYRIPQERLILQDDEKSILKSIARRYNLLPEEIINRRKFGAGIASNWMEDSSEFRTFAQELVLAPNSWVDELGLRDAMHRYYHNGETGYAFPRSISLFNNLSWRLLILNLWSNSLGISN